MADKCGHIKCSHFRKLFCLVLLCINSCIYATPSFQDYGLCGFIASTDIASISEFDEWSCTTDGVATGDPCVATMWSGITCTGGYVDSISLSSIGITGM